MDAYVLRRSPDRDRVRGPGSWHRRKGIAANSLILSLALAASGALAQSFDGAWSGTTAQGKPVSFTVTNNGIASLAVEYASSCATTRVTYSGGPSANAIGSCISQMIGSMAASGTVAADGTFALVLGTTSSGSSFGGRMQDGRMSGTWSDPSGLSGTFVATKDGAVSR